MRKVLVIILLIFSGERLALAQSKLDSLEQVLASQSTDSGRFVTLLALSSEAEFSEYKLARHYAEQASHLEKQIDKDWARLRLLFRLSFLESLDGDYSGALRYDLQAIHIAEDIGDSTSLARFLNDAGNDYRDMGEYKDAYVYLTQAYRVARRAHKPIHHEDSLNMAIATHNIGTVFTHLRQYDIAMAHLKSSASLSEKLRDLEGKPYHLTEMGTVYLDQGDPDEAEEYFDQAMAMARKLKIRVLIPKIKGKLAEAYYLMDQHDRSLLLYDSIMDYYKGTGNLYGQAECMLGQGRVLASRGKATEAATHFQKALQLAQQKNGRILKLACYQELANINEKEGRYRESLDYLRKYESLRDSIFSESTLEKLSQGQINFETEAKDSEIRSLMNVRLRQSQEIRKQELIRNVMVLVATLAVIVLFTVYRSGKRRKRINRLLLEHQQEIKRRSAELQQLNQVKDKFFSIISHDLRSPMNALAGTLSLLERNEITQQEFNELTRTLQTQFNHTRALITNLLDWTLLQMDKMKIQPEEVRLDTMVEESFAAHHNLYPKELALINEIPAGQTMWADPNILRLIIRNLILNAVKFTPQGGTIIVRYDKDGGFDRVSVHDTGIGIPPDALPYIFDRTSAYTTRGTGNEKGTGLGLILCKEFIEKCGGKISVTSEPGKGSTFSFILPRQELKQTI